MAITPITPGDNLPENAMMAVPREQLIEIGNAIREKRGTTADITIPDMPMEIGLIEGGGHPFEYEHIDTIDIDADNLMFNYSFQIPMKSVILYISQDAAETKITGVCRYVINNNSSLTLQSGTNTSASFPNQIITITHMGAVMRATFSVANAMTNVTSYQQYQKLFLISGIGPITSVKQTMGGLNRGSKVYIFGVPADNI